jgi:hypothetical protein
MKKRRRRKKMCKRSMQSEKAVLSDFIFLFFNLVQIRCFVQSQVKSNIVIGSVSESQQDALREEQPIRKPLF